MFGSQWPAYREVLNNPLPQFANNPEFEQIDVDASIAELEKAPLLRRMPLAVLTKTEPFARPPNLVGFIRGPGTVLAESGPRAGQT